jgi:uncharacterized linocin/CFP29 family protein
MSDDSPLPWTERQWTDLRSVAVESARKARVASTFLPLVGPVPADQATVPSSWVEIIQRGEAEVRLRGETDDRLEVRAGKSLHLVTIACNVYLRGSEIADPELNAAKTMVRRAGEVLGRLEDAIIFQGVLPNGEVQIDIKPVIYRITGGRDLTGLLYAPDTLLDRENSDYRGILANYNANYPTILADYNNAATAASATEEKAAAEKVVAAEKKADAEKKTADAEEKTADARQKTADAKPIVAAEEKAAAEGKAADARQIAADAEQKAADARQIAADAEQKAADARQIAADARQIAADAEQIAADAKQKAADAKQKVDAAKQTVDDAAKGIMRVSLKTYEEKNRPSPIVDTVVEAIQRLEGRGQFGPFAVVLGNDLFSDATTPSGSLVLPTDRLAEFLGGQKVLRSSVLPPDRGVVVALGGQPIELVLANDIDVKFLQVTLEPRYVLRVFERFVLRIKELDGVCGVIGSDQLWEQNFVPRAARS